jgi:hypothetical protein
MVDCVVGENGEVDVSVRGCLRGSTVEANVPSL